MQSQPNQSNQFTQSELQQLKAVLSREITDRELCAAEAKDEAMFWKEQGSKAHKDSYFTEMKFELNKAKKLAKLQKKVKSLISGKESPKNVQNQVLLLEQYRAIRGLLS